MSTEQDLIYDGHAVYQGMTDQARLRTGPDNVSDVLDSLHRLTKAARQQAVPGMIFTGDTDHTPSYVMGWNDCRAAALAAAPQAEHMLSAAPAHAERVEQEPVDGLLPCPHCGKDAEVRLYDCQYFVQCLYCFCSTPADLDTESQAAELWNQRTAPQPSPDPAEDWSVFPSYLLDKCEGQTVSEEMLQWWFASMIEDPHYGALFRREKSKHPSVTDMPAPAEHNPEHTLFNEIRISEPVNEDGEETRYLINEQQLQRIRLLEAPAAPDVAGLSQAATDLLAERQRQISAEGWTPDHDDEHRDGEMANAAACYALNAAVPMRGLLPPYWPWDRHWWKPSSSRRDLIKAGALILAEIERLDRAALAAHQNREG